MTSHRKHKTPTTPQVDELRKTVIACLGAVCGQPPRTDTPILESGQGLSHRPVPRQGKGTPNATLPNDPAANKTVLEFLTKVVSAAVANADLLGDHLQHVVDHLSAIGCTHKAHVESYFRRANRVLASLYLEAAKAHPSPSALTKLALRYALDARRPIEGDIDRFEIRRREDAWEVSEYPSSAMRAAAIGMPGRIVKNIFMVRIFECLHDRPPDIFGLMEHIERLLGGVPSLADSLEGDRGAGTQGSRPKIEVNLGKSLVWLDGEAFPVKESQAYFVQAVVSAGGNWISGPEMAESEKNALLIGPRPDRLYRGLPGPIRNRIESNRAAVAGFACGWRE